MSVTANIQHFHSEIPDHVTLVAVSKTKPSSLILEAYNAGQRIFGENKVQEMVSKHGELPHDIQWHMIGHLQSNKVKYMAPFVSLIHGVDSIKLLETIQKEGAKINRVIDCLLQVYIAKEETKFGMSMEELNEAIDAYLMGKFPHIRLRGLMGMATNTDNQSTIRNEFRNLKLNFDATKEKLDSHFNIISMGMSGDYQIAIEEGSNMVRIGSSIFGERTYPSSPINIL